MWGSARKEQRKWKWRRRENHRTNALTGARDGQSTKTRRHNISSQHNNSPTPPPVPMSTIKIATLNINGITARTRVWMLADFIQHDFDIIFAQEVTSTEVLNVRGYDTYLNIGTSIRGTAILARSTLHLTKVTTLPSGRAIAADYRGLRLINIYAPSGTARRADREQFYTTDLPHFFTTALPICLLGVISTVYYTPVTPQDTFNLAEPSRRWSAD